ncbi:hypothetical protein [Arthrobacter sp. NEB 688]|uniref:hypothetical protein n=1 Tax=Arthrobacter sp. NEB 688 TaxID=904039 RepID=UPI001566CFA8|nr:hypothetical protein [Arthrobacter sp. NEB 688]QKE82595.1 hypothetical protein HL663_00560 [Arthrobacter sp. NEB 688]
MRSLQLALQGAADVLVVGLLFGAGLPVIYALAMRALVVGAEEAPDGSVRYSSLGRLLAGLLVAVILGGVVLGLVLIVASGFGKAVSFEHVLPTIVDKK